ncbi:FAR1-related sequence 5-like protein [Tanacetum coccineum]|uniref:FAR1-related sequence 5-like protein n=1 Tax=Tanacetum coccineum TaxID=301880 RepID=A0ABQ5AXG3_9ASTR
MLNKYTGKKFALSESAILNLKAKVRHGQPETVRKRLKVPYSVKVPIGICALALLIYSCMVQRFLSFTNEKEAISKREMWLPTRVNLSRRGVLLDSHLCPLCNAAMEDVQHVFFRCDVARVVLRKICRWWDLDWQEICSFSDWDAWFLSFRLSSRLKSILEDQELKNIDDNQLKEADMVVDDEINLVDTEIQEVDGLIVDIDEEENLVATTDTKSIYLHSETPGGSVYWQPNVESIYLPIEGKVFDTIKECVDFYTFYAKIGGLEVKKSAQKKTKSGLVRSKYVMCNREGVPKDININTLDLENSDKQVRNTRHRITGCKARIKVDLHLVFGKYEITKFVSKHNHQMIPKHYKHLTKKQRKMTQAEKMFVVKASTMKLGATRTHNLYSSMKGGAQYVHGTSDDFKNHIRDVNLFIGESDAQMLINKMENRKKFVPNFTFQYKVENSELVAMFWADEVDKCNYKEFGDIISFDVTF